MMSSYNSIFTMEIGSPVLYSTNNFFSKSIINYTPIHIPVKSLHNSFNKLQSAPLSVTAQCKLFWMRVLHAKEAFRLRNWKGDNQSCKFRVH